MVNRKLILKAAAEIAHRLRAEADLTPKDDNPPVDVDDFELMVGSNETVVGFETLCSQLYENDEPIGPELHEMMRQFGQDVGVDLSYVERLRRRA